MLVGDVDKQAVVGRVEMEGFRVGRELNFERWIGLPWGVEEEVGGGMRLRGLAALGDREERNEWDGDEGTGAGFAARANQDELGGGFKADVVGISAEVGPRAFGVGAGVEGATGAVAAAADEKAIVFGQEEEALGLVDAADGVDAAAFGEVHYLNGVVFERGDEEFARGGANGQVIKPALDAFERDGADESERARRLGCGGGKAGRGQEQGQSGERLKVSASLCRHGGRIAAESGVIVTRKGAVTKA